MPSTAKTVIQAVDAAIEVFANQPFQGRSMLDHTTFLITSEFARTMRQVAVDFELSGMDHNPLTNTMIIGGKGVRGGMVIGESDFRAFDEELSPLHLRLDPYRIMAMGKPFDHGSGKTVSLSIQDEFDPKKFLSPMNVINTLQSILKVPATRRFTLGRGLPVADEIQALFA